jgi:hypothetical protein
MLDRVGGVAGRMHDRAPVFVTSIASLMFCITESESGSAVAVSSPAVHPSVCGAVVANTVVVCGTVAVTAVAVVDVSVGAALTVGSTEVVGAAVLVVGGSVAVEDVGSRLLAAVEDVATEVGVVAVLDEPELPQLEQISAAEAAAMPANFMDRCVTLTRIPPINGA